MKILLIYFLLIPLSSFAKDVQFNLAWLSRDKTIYRGAETWPKASVMLGIGVTLFEKLSLRGPNLQYTPFDRKSQHELTVGLRLFDDNRALLSIDSYNKGYRNQRDPSLELGAGYYYKFGPVNLFKVGAFIGQDFIEYNSYYSEFLFEVPAMIKFLKARVLISYADLATQKYLYGSDAKGGFGFSSLEFSYFRPDLGFCDVFIASAGFSHLIHDENDRADYIRGNGDKIYSSIIMSWGL